MKYSVPTHELPSMLTSPNPAPGGPVMAISPHYNPIPIVNVVCLEELQS